jgi:hypothetical protein
MDTVTLSLSNLPFGSDSIRIEHFVVDRNHSNSYQTWVGLGKPANPTAAQWTTISNASQLAHYDSVTTAISTGGAFTKKFTQNYYSLGLIIITKAKPASSIKNSAERADKYILNSTIITNVLNRKANISMPYEGEYAVQLYTTKGCKLMDVKEYGPGSATVSLENLPAGFYILHCVNRVKSLDVPVFLGR